jgi:hypothetical protein
VWLLQRSSIVSWRCFACILLLLLLKWSNPETIYERTFYIVREEAMYDHPFRFLIIFCSMMSVMFSSYMSRSHMWSLVCYIVLSFPLLLGCFYSWNKVTIGAMLSFREIISVFHFLSCFRFPCVCFPCSREFVNIECWAMIILWNFVGAYTSICGTSDIAGQNKTGCHETTLPQRHCSVPEAGIQCREFRLHCSFSKHCFISWISFQAPVFQIRYRSFSST